MLICSLHPLGLPLTQPPGGGVLDFILEVRAQPDQHAAVPQSGLALAWRDATRQLTQADLLTEVPTDRRRLVRPSDPWTTVREALLAPLLGGGSSVVVTGPATPDQLGSIAGQEQADLPAGTLTASGHAAAGRPGTPPPRRDGWRPAPAAAAAGRPGWCRPAR